MNKIIFSKYSNERAKRFALRTDILKTSDGREVRKKALYPEGKEHIRHIKTCELALNQRYENTRIVTNRCEYEDESVYLEYLTGQTLEEQLDSLVLAGRYEEVLECLMQYLEEMKKGFQLSSFHMTEEFRQVFGDVSLPENLLSGDVVDIDMVLNNVIADHVWTLIDYEWTFEFPVPYDFVAYRVLYYYLHGSSTRDGLLKYDLIRKIGITQEQERVYEAMERHFQEIYVQTEAEQHQLHIPIRLLYDEMSPGIVEIDKLGLGIETTMDMRMVQLYHASTYAFTEDASEKREPILTKRMEGTFSQSFTIPEKGKYIRLDPASQCCIIRELQVYDGRTAVSIKMMNGQKLADKGILFTNDDPWMIFERRNIKDPVVVRFKIEYLTTAEALQLANVHMEQLMQTCVSLQTQLAEKEEQIRQMENTKVWKAYRKLKRD